MAPGHCVEKSSPESNKKERETKEILCVADGSSLHESVFDKFSRHKALRILSWMAKFVHNIRQGVHKVTGLLQSEELGQQELLCIKRVQKVLLRLQLIEGMWKYCGIIQGEYHIYLPTECSGRHGDIGRTMANVRESFGSLAWADLRKFLW